MISLPQFIYDLFHIHHYHSSLSREHMNHIMAALKFNERRQGDNESFDCFVTDLKILVKNCGYQEEERMVRDAIVFRCKHPKVREKCLDQADALTC